MELPYLDSLFFKPVGFGILSGLIAYASRGRVAKTPASPEKIWCLAGILGGRAIQGTVQLGWHGFLSRRQERFARICSGGRVGPRSGLIIGEFADRTAS